MHYLLILAIEFDESLNNAGNSVVLHRHAGVVYSLPQDFVEKNAKSRSQNANPRPPAESEPSVNKDAAALRIQFDGPAKQE